MTPPILLAVMGPTASGKTGLAEALADRLDAQLINADAFQVYRGFDIGTAKPGNKHLYELIDIKDPEEAFGVGEWVRLASKLLTELHRENRNAVIVGGTGFYIRALLERYTEMSSSPPAELRERLMAVELEGGLEALLQQLNQIAPNAKVDRKNPVRVRRAIERALSEPTNIEVDYPEFRQHKIVLELSTEELNRRIAQRLQAMLENGWIEEVQTIKANGVPYDAPAMRAIGYQAISSYLDGSLAREKLYLQIETQTRQYAKRQRTWLRSEPGARKIPAEAETDRLAQEVLSLFGLGD